jgi:hypothetical protein
MRPSAEILAVKGYFLRRNSRRICWSPELRPFVIAGGDEHSDFGVNDDWRQGFSLYLGKRNQKDAAFKSTIGNYYVVRDSALGISVFVVKSPNYEILSA